MNKLLKSVSYKYKHRCSYCQHKYDSDFEENTVKEKKCYVCKIKLQDKKPRGDYEV